MYIAAEGKLRENHEIEGMLPQKAFGDEAQYWPL